MNCAVFLASALAVLAAAQTPASKTEVTSFPGWDGPLPSRVFTGYIDAGTPPSGVGSMYFHYWMVESEGNPATDPVIMWYNGGPGASSLFGMLQELGPLMLNSESYDAKYNKTGIPSPKYNPFTWAKHATLIALDSPPPIGFSYCTEQGPAAGGTSCGPWTDDTVFKANHEAHKTLFNKIFPELKPNPFFFAGILFISVMQGYHTNAQNAQSHR
jgi:carboxypeptidase C (cathepsin A)